MGTAVNLFRGKEQRMICFSKQIFTVKKKKSLTDLQSLEELVSLLDTAYIFFGFFDISPRSWRCDTTKMCYIFTQNFHVSWGKTKSRLGYVSLPLFFCHLPLFGRHVTSLNQGLSFHGWKALGTRLEVKGWWIDEFYSYMQIDSKALKPVFKRERWPPAF